MKPIFAVNVDDKKNTTDNSGAFRTATVSDELTERYEVACDRELGTANTELDESLRRRYRTRTTRTLILAAVLSGILLFFELVVNHLIGGKTIEPILLILPTAYVLALIAYLLVRLLRSKKPTEKPTPAPVAETEEAPESIADVERLIYEAFGAPADAARIDILYFDYKSSPNGEPAIRKKGKTVEFINMDMRIFRDGDSLCLADLDARYDFPISSVRGIRRERGAFSLLFWNKSTPCDSGEYRLFGMTKNNYDNVLFGTLHILELEVDGETYGIYFPAYELDAVKALLDA